MILWFQIIDEAKDTSKPVLFVTDDQKDDWWLGSDKAATPRPELANEMYREAAVLSHMYKPLEFVSWAGQRLEQEISEEAAGEIEELQPLEDSEAHLGLSEEATVADGDLTESDLAAVEETLEQLLRRTEHGDRRSADAVYQRLSTYEPREHLERINRLSKFLKKRY